MPPKSVGILGGMGPEATVDLMHRVIRATPATDDCDHIHLVVDNNPQVPSRIKALIEKTGQDPLPCLQDMARKLEAWGVDFLAMPCNTAHYYHERIQNVVGIPLLNMIDISGTAVLHDSPRIQAVGILASSAVLDLRLYDQEFAAQNIAVVHPEFEPQQRLMQAIRTIKTCNYSHLEHKALQAPADSLLSNGAEVIVIACTELSILAGGLNSPVRCYDTAQLLAEAIVQKATQ